MGEYYEIVIKGYIDRYRATWFDDVAITNLPSGEAILSASVANDTELASLLDRVCDLGMPLLQVKRRNLKPS